MNRLCELVMNGVKLTDDVLLENGFDVRELVKQKVIMPSLDEYTISSHVLYKYGRELSKEKALACFDKCHELNPKDGIVVLHLMLDCLDKENYLKMFDYIMPLTSVNDPWLEADLNTYLYILSFITEIPNEYRYYIDRIKEQHLICDLHKNSINYLRVRKLIYQREFAEAQNLLNQTTSDKDKKKIRYVFLNALLSHTCQKESDIKEYYIADFTNYLVTDQLAKALKVARNYLSAIDRIQYEFVILNLISSAFIEGDYEFNRVFDVINDIDNHLSLDEYIAYFYEALGENSFDACKCYLNIINGLSDYVYNQDLSEALSQKMNKEKILIQKTYRG